MTDGFGTGPDELRKAAGRISGVVGGVNDGELARVDGSAIDYGHDGVQRAVADFCLAVERSVQVLVQTSESAADSLRDTAKSYEEQDHSVQEQLTRAGKNVTRDGHG